MGQSTLKTVIIEASGDAYLVTDLASEEDPQGFRDTNYGSLEFLKTWYAWGIVGEERLLSVDLVKFDLQELQDLDIESVSLQLFARQADLTEPARLVDIHLVQGPWAEDTVTFNTRPAWDRTPVATAAIYGAGGWYSWNVSGTVSAAARRGEISYTVALRSAAEENEEQVLFVAREGGGNGPRLLVTYRPAPSSGIEAIDWWWWVAVGAGGVVVLTLVFLLGRGRRRRQPSWENQPPMAPPPAGTSVSPPPAGPSVTPPPEGPPVSSPPAEPPVSPPPTGSPVVPPPEEPPANL